MRTDYKLLIVSNRLPVAMTRDGDGWRVRNASGGLVTALAPIMKQVGGLWVGWPGCPQTPSVTDLLTESVDSDFDMKPVWLTEEEIDRYYRGYSNRTIWPLFHDLLGYFSFDTSDWHTYRDVNRRFAEVVAESISDNTFVWIHDYQLLLVGHYLRQMGIECELNFFLHIPFPGDDMYRRLPSNGEVLRAILAYDHIGFQTLKDRRNFISCVRNHHPEILRRNYRRYSVLDWRGRKVRIGNYAISIDFNEFDHGSRSKEVQEAGWYLHENHGDKKLVLGLDRLDYTKGIKERFLAFERLLEKYPELQGDISLVQIVVPSRLNVPDYASLKEELDSLCGRINGRFAREGWIPIHYEFRHLNRTQLLGHYRACEIALITPLRDGMNLVAKEYCASSVDNRGVLILSEFAGAAVEFAENAIIVNPFDIENTADAIYAAHVMSSEERANRMVRLRSIVSRHTVQRWVRAFLDAAGSLGAGNQPTGGR
ncbi:MAG: trehalose-6-phosphate synthase [bacterium]